MVQNPRLRPTGKSNGPSQFGKACGPPPTSQRFGNSTWNSEMPHGRQPQAPLFALNALDEQCNIKDESHDLLQAIIGNWANLSQAEREKCAQIVTGSKVDPVPAPSRFNRVIERFTVTRSSHADSSTARLKSKSKSKTKVVPQPKVTAPKKRKECLSDSSDDDNWEDHVRLPTLPRISFRVDDTEKVEAFLYTRFMQIQQSAGKVIAKAWIKSICPKKQANYPYVDSNPRHDQPRRRPRHDGPPRIPIFWPKLDLCRHKEPDHLDKNERTLLLVHLVRIFWGKEEWKRSNGETADIPQFVMTGDWVQFLQESFPPERLAEVAGATTAKTRQRMQYLSDIYKVALAEQSFRQGGNDGKTMFTFTGDIKLLHPKDVRPRRPRHALSLSEDRRQIDAADNHALPGQVFRQPVSPASPFDESACSATMGEGPNGTSSESETIPTRDYETAPTSRANTSYSDMAACSGPWLSADSADIPHSLMNPSGMQIHRDFKAEPAPDPHTMESVPYYDPMNMLQYGSSQAELPVAPMWDDRVAANMGYCERSLQTSLTNEPVSLAGGATLLYREDLGALDPMLDHMSLRSQASEEASYCQLRAQQQVIQYGTQAPICLSGQPQGPTLEEMMAVGKFENEIEQQRHYNNYMGQQMGAPGQPLPYGAQYGPHMVSNRQLFAPEIQMALMPEYTQF